MRWRLSRLCQLQCNSGRCRTGLILRAYMLGPFSSEVLGLGCLKLEQHINFSVTVNLMNSLRNTNQKLLSQLLMSKITMRNIKYMML